MKRIQMRPLRGRLIAAVSTILPLLVFSCGLLEERKVYVGVDWLYDHPKLFHLACIFLTIWWQSRCPVKRWWFHGARWECVYNLLPLSLYLGLVFLKHRPIAGAAASIAVVVAGWILVASVSEKHRERDRMIAARAISLLLVCIAAIQLPFCVYGELRQRQELEDWIEIHNTVGERKLESIAVSADTPRRILMRENQETLRELRCVRWAQHVNSERLALLADVAGMELSLLGCSSEGVRIGSVRLPKGVLGQYNHETRQISLSAELISEQNPEQVLRTLLHEVYHAYQHQLVDLLEEYGDSPLTKTAAFDVARIWQKNLTFYIEGEEAFDPYQLQPLEESARAFSDEEFETLTEMIRQ